MMAYYFPVYRLWMKGNETFLTLTSRKKLQLCCKSETRYRPRRRTLCFLKKIFLQCSSIAANVQPKKTVCVDRIRNTCTLNNTVPAYALGGKFIVHLKPPLCTARSPPSSRIGVHLAEARACRCTISPRWALQVVGWWCWKTEMADKTNEQ